MLRKYGIGLMAIIIGIGMAAFTAPKKTHLDATHVFEFDGLHNTYTVGNVQTTSNWKYVGEDELLCEGEDKACRIKVTDDYVDQSSTPMQLSGITISASNNPNSGEAVVSGITAPLENGYSNQDDN